MSFLCIKVEILWISLMGVLVTFPGKFLPIQWHFYLFIALFLFWPLDWLYERHRQSTSTQRIDSHSNNPLWLTTLSLLACFPLSLWMSIDYATSYSAIGYVLWGLALCQALIGWPLARAKPKWVAWAILVGGSLLSVAALPIVYWKTEFRLFRLPLYDQLSLLQWDVGETIHANVLASVIVLLLPLLFALMLRQWIKPYQRLAHSLLFLLLFGILILTQSRGGYLAMLVVLPLIVLLRWPRLLYVTPLLLLIVMGLILQLGISNVLDLLSTDGSLGGWVGRIDIWKQSVNAIRDFPFTGIGFGTFTTVIPLLYPLLVSIEGYPHAHNLFLQIGVDLGVGGLVAYCAILLTLFAMLWRTLRTFPRQSTEWALALGSLGSLVAMLVHGLLDAATWISKIAFFPWILFALITLLFLRAERGEWQSADDES